MTQDKKLQVEAICKGTVIDHIPAGQGIKILKLFSLAQTQERVTIGLNLRSGQDAGKDLIKIENTTLSEEQANELALLAPTATVNFIENYQVIGKKRLELPQHIRAVFTCPNANCITRVEPIDSFFNVSKTSESAHLKCHYCEKEFSREVMVERF